MLEKIRETLDLLGIDTDDAVNCHLLNVFLIGIFQDGGFQINDEYDYVDWPKTRQAVVFVFNKHDNRWTIRHIDENYRIHKQYIGRNGHRICIDDWDERRIVLYRHLDIREVQVLNCDNFKSIIKGIWSSYRNCLHGTKSVEWRLLSP